MPNAQNPDEEAKSKLRKMRADFTRARNIVAEIEAYFEKFEKIRAKLDDDKDGLEINLDWSQRKKAEIDSIVVEIGTKASELTTTAAMVKDQAEAVEKQYSNFQPLASKITDPSTGIEAMHTQATSLKDKISALLETATNNATKASEEFEGIEAISVEVKKAYDAFLIMKAGIDDPETGVQAQVDEIAKYSKDALKAKTDAEKELAAVISLKDKASEDLESIKSVKNEIEGHKDESFKLTDDIRNNLGLSTAHSLSQAISDQRKRIEHSVWLWGGVVAIAILLLGGALGVIFYTIFIDAASKSIVKADGIGLFVTVLSKALFSSPFVFALYFGTTNFSRARDLRDRYRSKEIAAKNLQAYVKLLRDEFPDSSVERLRFALSNMQSIYNDPVPSQRKRRYNIGVNKIFQFDVQEEDVEQLKEKLIEGAEEIIEKQSLK